MLEIIKNKKAFTLLEVIIVTLIISFGLLGVFSLFLQAIKVQNINKNELVASQLAQEGLEIIRNIRDSNWDLNNSFDNSLSDDTYILDYNGRDSLTSITDIDKPGANLKIDTGKYLINGSKASPFNRVVIISKQINYLDVSCVVQWNEKGNKKQYTAQTYLYDWN